MKLVSARLPTEVEVLVSVVVPVHDEAENVEPLLKEVRAALEGHVDFEVVCVDDGSDDETADRLASLAESWPRLRVVHHPRRKGQSAALVSGVRAARGVRIVTLDGDGQNDPADILRLLAVMDPPAAPAGVGLVIGNRHLRQDSPIKRISSRIANLIRSRFLNDDTPDAGCGIKLFDRSAFLAVPQFDHMHRFLPALFRMTGWRTVSVPVNHRPRRHGRSHYGLFDRLWAGTVDLAGVLWLKHRLIHPVSAENTDEH
jgi:dolichol-phosphate mannosyltransferase